MRPGNIPAQSGRRPAENGTTVTERETTVPHVVRIAVLLALLAPAVTGAAPVYRCPDGSYADKPCGADARVVTTTRRSSPEGGARRACIAVGQDAEQISRRKAGGASAAQLLTAVDNGPLSFEEKAARKKFVVTVFQTPGSPAEVRALAEADCVARTRAAEAAQAAPKPAPAEPAPAAAAAPAGMPKEHCDRLRKDLAALRKHKAALAEVEGMEVPSDGRDERDNPLAGLCP